MDIWGCRVRGAKAAFLILSVVCVPCVGGAADSSVLSQTDIAAAETLRDRALAGQSRAFDFVSRLTTLFGPRPAGSAAERDAAQWAADELNRMGFRNVTIERFPMTAWVRGQESGQIVTPHPQPLVVTALGGAPPTPETGIEGPVALFASLDALTNAPAGSLSGKIAVVEQRTPRMQNEDAYRVTAQARALGPIEAARRGAIAFLLRSIGTDSHRLAHTGSTHYVDGKVPIPAFALSAPDADQLERLAALKQQVTVRLFSSAHYVPGATSQNVVADIPGTDRAGEIVLLGAHLDSWELGTGAVDDGAGDAIIVGAAKLIADLPERPRRTIRVVLYGAEEVNEPHQLPLGNRFYILKHGDEIARHVLTGESDYGADRIYALSLSDKTANSPFGKAVRDVLSPLGILPASQGPGRGGVDVGPLVEAGVPDFLLEQDGTRYFDIHHSSDDTLDKIDPEQFNQNVAAWTALVWLAANSNTDFRRIEKEVQP